MVHSPHTYTRHSSKSTVYLSSKSTVYLVPISMTSYSFAWKYYRTLSRLFSYLLQHKPNLMSDSTSPRCTHSCECCFASAGTVGKSRTVVQTNVVYSVSAPVSVWPLERNISVPVRFGVVFRVYRKYLYIYIYKISNYR
jgi:hypothetical protein